MFDANKKRKIITNNNQVSRNNLYGRWILSVSIPSCDLLPQALKTFLIKYFPRSFKMEVIIFLSSLFDSIFSISIGFFTVPYTPKFKGDVPGIHG